jgi:hypothetical protein
LEAVNYPHFLVRVKVKQIYAEVQFNQNNGIELAEEQTKQSRTLYNTDYKYPERAFFENSKLLGLGRQIGPNILGTFRVFFADLSAPILVLCVSCPCFPLINHYFHKN